MEKKKSRKEVKFMEREEYEKLLAEKEAACQKRLGQMKAEVEAKEKRMMEIINSTYPMNVLASKVKNKP